MKQLFLPFIFVASSALCALAQSGGEMLLSLDDAIAMARVRSVDAAEALDELRSSYWEWRSFKAEQFARTHIQGHCPIVCQAIQFLYE